MKTIFLDCGSHHLEGLAHFLDNGIINESFEIHTFEPNPECRVEERLKNFKYKNLNCTLHKKAVWLEDGKVSFNQENHKWSNSGSPTDGTSDLDGWASSIGNIGFHFPGYAEPIEVESIDFNRFVKELPEDSTIICKLDVEGSEFEILRKMISEGTINKISKLYVEFHERYMPSESEDSKNKIVNEIRSRGIEVNTWF
jgi:FkbM family methyltransferase